MWESRATLIKKKPKVVLSNRKFPTVNQLELGSKGMLLMQADIDAERLEFQEDGNERIIKSVRPISIELLENKAARL